MDIRNEVGVGDVRLLITIILFSTLQFISALLTNSEPRMLVAVVATNLLATTLLGIIAEQARGVFRLLYIGFIVCNVIVFILTVDMISSRFGS